MKKRFLVVLLIVLSLLLLVSCSSENGVNDNGGSQSGTLFDPYNVSLLSAYSQAQELGFAGTLEEFIELISGKDGEDGKDGKDGVTPTIEVSDDGYWVINGTKTEYKALGIDGNNGTDGEDGKDGATIDKIEFDENGKLVITLTDGTVLAPIDLPEKEEHSHIFETWYIQEEIVLDSEYCENRVFCAVCTECGELGWKIGSDDDHLFDIKTVAPTCADQGYDIKTCTVCGKEEKINLTDPDPSAHAWSEEYSNDELYHWIDCTLCDENNEYAKHNYVNNGRYCEVCNYTGITSAPAENVAYKLFLYQKNNKQNLFALNTIVDEKFIKATDDPTNASDYYVEKVDGGYKFYTFIDDVKSYVDAYTVIKDESTGELSKRLKFSTDGDVWTYDAKTNGWYTTVNDISYALGTYSTFTTFSIFNGDYLSEFNTGLYQFPAGFIAKPHAGALTPAEIIIYDTPEDIINAAYNLEKGATLSDGHLYTLTGVITEVNTPYDSRYGNITVTIVVGNMTDKPIECFRLEGTGIDVIKVGDTITVTGEIIKYDDKTSDGSVEFDTGCTLDSYILQ